jgi:hypothetical protein
MVMMAWLAHADCDASEVELEMIRRYGRTKGVNPQWTEHLLGNAARGTVRAPNFERLAQSSEDALSAAESLIAVDGVLDDDELSILKTLRKRLGTE